MERESDREVDREREIEGKETERKKYQEISD